MVAVFTVQAFRHYGSEVAGAMPALSTQGHICTSLVPSYTGYQRPLVSHALPRSVGLHADL